MRKTLLAAVAISLACITVFVVVAAWLLSRPVPPKIDAADAVALAASADRLMLNTPADEVPRHVWPAAFRKYEPEAVWIRQEGMYLRTGSAFVEDWGIFVPRAGSRFPFERSGDPSYRLLGDRIYWYFTKG